MASFASLKAQIEGKIPYEERAHYSQIINEWVTASITKVSKLWEWDWRKRVEDLSVVTSQIVYNMPNDCDLISAENGVFVDSSGNPTNNRVVCLTEDAFNQLFIDEQGDSETADIPRYFVPLAEPSSQSQTRIRIYPKSDASRTLRIYYFTNPSVNDANNMIEDLILYDVYSKMPAAFEPEATTWAMRYRSLAQELRPHHKKAMTSVPLWTQDVQMRKHNIAQADRQSRK